MSMGKIGKYELTMWIHEVFKSKGGKAFSFIELPDHLRIHGVAQRASAAGLLVQSIKYGPESRAVWTINEAKINQKQWALPSDEKV